MTTPSEQTLGQLVASASRDLSQLVHQEIALAKSELRTEVKSAGLGAGMLVGAAGAGLFAVIFLSIALAYGISALGIPLGAGFLVVGLLYLTFVVLFALLGKRNLSKVGAPEQTVRTVKDTVAWAKNPTQPVTAAKVPSA